MTTTVPQTQLTASLPDDTRRALDEHHTRVMYAASEAVGTFQAARAALESALAHLDDEAVKQFRAGPAGEILATLNSVARAADTSDLDDIIARRRGDIEPDAFNPPRWLNLEYVIEPELVREARTLAAKINNDTGQVRALVGRGLEVWHLVNDRIDAVDGIDPTFLGEVTGEFSLFAALRDLSNLIDPEGHR